MLANLLIFHEKSFKSKVINYIFIRNFNFFKLLSKELILLIIFDYPNECESHFFSQLF